MNLLGKITKTQLLLLFMTLSFLLALTLLYDRASSTMPGADYTITVTQRENEPVTPQPPPLVDINTATSEELQTLTGIGPAMAQRIIDYREEHGPFSCIDDLLHVSGIGEATLQKFRDHVTVSSSEDPGTEDKISTSEDDTDENTGR